MKSTKQQEKIICNRCGGERKISKKWFEGEGANKFEVIETVCLNSECQAALDKEQAESLKRRDFLASQRDLFQQKREQERLQKKKDRMDQIV